jgi:predicted MFS family arabinose efflux permease
MTQDPQKEEKKDPFDGEYIGNIWGWRVSFIGLAVILFFVGLMIYRFQTLDPSERGEFEDTELVAPDSVIQRIQPSEEE